MKLINNYHSRCTKCKAPTTHRTQICRACRPIHCQFKQCKKYTLLPNRLCEEHRGNPNRSKDNGREETTVSEMRQANTT